MALASDDDEDDDDDDDEEDFCSDSSQCQTSEQRACIIGISNNIVSLLSGKTAILDRNFVLDFWDEH